MDLHELQGAYLLTFPQKIVALQETVKSRSLPQLLHLTHQLAGSSGSYGFMDLFALTNDLEQMIHSSDNFNDAIEQQAQAVITCMQQLQKS